MTNEGNFSRVHRPPKRRASSIQSWTTNETQSDEGVTEDGERTILAGFPLLQQQQMEVIYYIRKVAEERS